MLASLRKNWLEFKALGKQAIRIGGIFWNIRQTKLKRNPEDHTTPGIWKHQGFDRRGGFRV
jgi:hypothetical protein